MRLETTIAKLRKEKEMTQEDLSEIVHASRETIGRIERGQYNPSLKLAYDIAHVFDKNVEEVFFFKEDK